jgi:hypothetical protein
MTPTVTDELVASLEGFAGTLLLPGDPGYEHARGVYNAMIDRRPALIARCRGVPDVVAAVGLAREHELGCPCGAAATAWPASRSPRAAS